MQNLKINSLLQKVLLFFGERLAIISFAVFVFVLLISGQATQALSKQKDTTFVAPKSNWYQDNVSLPIKNAQNETSSYNISIAEITPTPTPEVVISANANDAWESLAQCETHGSWSSNTGNGYYGGLQFSQSAWDSTGGTGNPSQASRDEQIMRGKNLQSRRGWQPWITCARKLGLI